MASPDPPDGARPPAAWRDAAHALVGAPTLTRRDVAVRAGWSVDEARRVWNALGLPPLPDDQPAHTAADVAVLQALRALVERREIDLDVALQIARLIGRATSRVADAVVMAVTEHPGPDGPRTPDQVAREVQELGPTLEPFLAHVWRHQLLASLLRTMAAGPATDEGRVLAVGFADLVGFTAVTQRLDAATLTRMVERFEAVAYERLVAPGARVVKMIGDEVMFAAEAPAQAVDAALALVEACAGDPMLPAVRVGLAVGPTFAWNGDLFGPTVNLASRLVALARPGTVLLSEELGAALPPDAFDLRHLRATGLKGFGRVRSWVVRRATPA
jgi:adenylate cyclase